MPFPVWLYLIWSFTHLTLLLERSIWQSLKPSILWEWSHGGHLILVSTQVFPQVSDCHRSPDGIVSCLIFPHRKARRKTIWLCFIQRLDYLTAFFRKKRGPLMFFHRAVLSAGVGWRRCQGHFWEGLRWQYPEPRFKFRGLSASAMCHEQPHAAFQSWNSPRAPFPPNAASAAFFLTEKWRGSLMGTSEDSGVSDQCVLYWRKQNKKETAK